MNFNEFFGFSLILTGIIAYIRSNQHSKITYSVWTNKIYESSDMFEIHMIQSPLTVLDKNELDAVYSVLDAYKKRENLNSKYVQVNINGKTIDFITDYKLRKNTSYEQLVFNINYN